jgi:hypothetical protein
MMRKLLMSVALVLLPVMAAVASCGSSMSSTSAAGGCQSMACGQSPTQPLMSERPLCPLVPESERALDKGVVILDHQPTVLHTGKAQLVVQVDRISGQLDRSARISAFLFPMGSPSLGRDIHFATLNGGRFAARTKIGPNCPEILAIRVIRPGMSDSLVEFPLTLAQ